MTSDKHTRSLIFAAIAAVLFSTGGLGIKLTKLSGLELSSARSLVAVLMLLAVSRVLSVREHARTRDGETIKSNAAESLEDLAEDKRDNRLSSTPNDSQSASDFAATTLSTSESESASELTNKSTSKSTNNSTGELTSVWWSRLASARIDFLLIAAVVFYAGTLALFVQATKLTTAANAIFLQYSAPVYVLLLEPLIFREKYKARDFIVVVVCLCGMSLFFTGEMQAGDVRGNVIALVSGGCYAMFTLLLRLRARIRHAANRFAPIIYGNLFLGLILLPFLIKGLSANALTITDALIVLYLGVFQIGLAYAFFTTAIARGARSLDIFIIGFIEPILNPLLVLLVINERPNFYALLGGAIIIGAACAHGIYESKARRAVQA